MNRSGRIWPWALGVVLALTVGGNLWVMQLANADPSFSVEPDYYRKAVEWDSTMAQQQRNATLGWQLSVESMQVAGAQALLTVLLVDSVGAPIPDGTLSVDATHNALADQVVTTTLVPAGSGRYTGTIKGARPGIWELRLVATRGADRFTTRLRHDTARKPAAR